MRNQICVHGVPPEFPCGFCDVQMIGIGSPAVRGPEQIAIGSPKFRLMIRNDGAFMLDIACPGKAPSVQICQSLEETMEAIQYAIDLCRQ